ncbi:hypothetical protein [Amorphus sp. MBR-141]
MENQYMRRNRWNESELDVSAFVRDLAGAMGGSVEPDKSDIPDDMRHSAAFTLDGNSLSFSRVYNKPDRVEIHISADDVQARDRDHYTKAHKAASATLSTSRPLDKIAADVWRRVIEPSQDALAGQRERRDVLATRRAEIVETVERLRAALPESHVDIESDGLSASFRAGGHCGYLYARVDRDCVTIDRMQSVPVSTFLEIVALLERDKARGK